MYDLIACLNFYLLTTIIEGVVTNTPVKPQPSFHNHHVVISVGLHCVGVIAVNVAGVSSAFVSNSTTPMRIIGTML